MRGVGIANSGRGYINSIHVCACMGVCKYVHIYVNMCAGVCMFTRIYIDIYFILFVVCFYLCIR